MCIIGQDLGRPFRRDRATEEIAKRKPVRITGDNDGTQPRKCLVLDTPIRKWYEARKDFVDDWWKASRPPPGSETMGIGKSVHTWENNAEVLLDSGASRDFGDERMVLP